MTTESGRSSGASSSGNLREATIVDSLRIALQIVIPTLAVGVIKRRPKMMWLSEKLQLDRLSVDFMRQLRTRYGDAPLRVRVPGRSVVLLLSGQDVGKLLRQAPVPFSPDTKEKNAALRHFQPHGVLISQGAERSTRRKFNETILEPERPLHELAMPFAKLINEETLTMLADAERSGTLDWKSFAEHWWRLVRRVSLGEQAAYDQKTTDLLARLRLDANWAYLHPRRQKTRQIFNQRLSEHLARAELNSLAGVIANTSRDSSTLDRNIAADQVAHWLFAFDAAGMVTFRALALLASHPSVGKELSTELGSLDLDVPQQLRYARACVLESVRLWPTTPMLLRESVADTEWGRAGTTYLAFTPFFHRDEENLPYAHRFSPEVWMDGRAEGNPALVPFSDGPAICPGRNLVLFIASTVLAGLWRSYAYELDSESSPGEDNMPLSLDNFSLKFTVKRR